MDPQHPAYDPAVDPQYRSVVEDLYVEMDAIVGRTLAALRPRRSPRHHVGPRLRLVAPRVQPEHLAARQRLSDAAASAARQERRRLLQRHRLVAHACVRRWGSTGSTSTSGDASRRDRRSGARATRWSREIGDKLLRTIDPRPGSRPSPARSAARRPTRWPATKTSHRTSSSATRRARGLRRVRARRRAAGGHRGQPGAWSGDHCMDPDAVPGILLTSRPLAQDSGEPAGAGGGPAGGARHRRISIDRQGALNHVRIVASSSTRPCSPGSKRYADLAGYSSVEEFITHALEKEIAQLEKADSRGRDQEAAEGARLHLVGRRDGR